MIVRLAKMGVTLIGLLATVLAGSCLAAKSGKLSGEDDLKSVQLIVDRHFENGFHLLSPVDGSKVRIGVLNFGKVGSIPAWELAQWYSKHSLLGVQPQNHGSAMAYENEAKSVIVGPPTSEFADLTLRVNSGVEFGFEPMKPGDGWPHLFATQPLPRNQQLRIGNLEAALLSFEAKLLNVDFYSKQPEGARRRAAHFHVNLRIQNLNRASNGYGDWYAFSFPVYDTRYLFVPAYASQDVGGGDKIATGKYVFRPAALDIGIKETLHSREWVDVEVDVLPYIHAGLNDAWSKGFLPDSRDLNDYYIADITVGWEVWGIMDIGMQIRNLSLVASYFD